MDKNDWIQKYKPKKINDLVTNVTAVKNIQSWLLKFDGEKQEYMNNKVNKKARTNKKNENRKNGEPKIEPYKSCMIATGGHGNGKTCSVDIILKEMNYEICYLDIKKNKICKDINTIITQSMISQNILSLMISEEKKKNVIVVDNLESITSSTEKASILNLQRMNDIHWHCPIIFISNNRHNKLLSDIKKASYEVKFFPPYLSDLATITRNIAKKESILFENSFVVDKIVVHCQGDIRQLIFTLYNIKYNYDNKKITNKLLREYFDTSNVRDIDIDLYKATNKLFKTYKNIASCMSLYETEKVLLPLMMQQNYINCIIENNSDDDTKYELASLISDSLSMGDITENYIYGEQNWSMQDVHGIFSCVNPSYYINANSKNESENFTLAFPADLNKTSIKSINKKNIVNADRCLKNMNIFDYIFISKMMYHHIMNNNIKECVGMLFDYNIEMEYIESLLKINKIRKSKSTLTLKQKKEFILWIDYYKNEQKNKLLGII